MPRQSAVALLASTTRAATRCLSAARLADARAHAARKALKKAPAALRLLRPALGNAAYARENAALRDVGRCLSPLRDAKSLVTTLDAVLAARERAPFAALRRRLAQRLRAARRNLSRKAVRDRCANELAASRARLEAVALGGGQCGTSSALRRIYRKARKAYRRATATPTSPVLHEWRKQVKYLHAAARALPGARRHSARKQLDRAKKIASRLGDDHDLMMLRDAIVEWAGADGDRAADLQARMRRRSTALRRRALAGGARLFATKAKRFVADFR